MDKTYPPAALERRHYERWEKANYFAPTGRGIVRCRLIIASLADEGAHLPTTVTDPSSPYQHSAQ